MRSFRCVVVDFVGALFLSDNAAISAHALSHCLSSCGNDGKILVSQSAPTGMKKNGAYKQTSKEISAHGVYARM